MALNVYTPFTADRSVLQGGLALGAGIGGGLQSLGDAVTGMLEKKKQRGQLLTSLRKTLSIANPERKDDYNEMTLEDLQGALEGEALQSARAKAERSGRLDEAMLAEHQARTATIQEALANARIEPRFLGRMSELMAPRLEAPPSGAEGPANQLPGAPGIAALLQASQETGFRPDLRGVLDDLIRSGDTEGPQSFFKREEFGVARPVRDEQGNPVAGRRVMVTGPNTARDFEESAGDNAVEMVAHPETGEALGFWVNHAGAKPVWKALPQDSGLTRDEISAMNTEMRPWGDALFLKLNKTSPEQASTKIDGIRQKYLDIAARRKGRGATAPAAPPEPAQRTKGAVYQTPRGLLKWTGTGWVAP